MNFDKFCHIRFSEKRYTFFAGRDTPKKFDEFSTFHTRLECTRYCNSVVP